MARKGSKGASIQKEFRQLSWEMRPQITAKLLVASFSYLPGVDYLVARIP